MIDPNFTSLSPTEIFVTVMIVIIINIGAYIWYDTVRNNKKLQEEQRLLDEKSRRSKDGL